MPKARTTGSSGRKIRPALSPEARENQMISLAVDLAEAKAESIKSQKDMEKVYLDAMAAMREYRGEGELDDED